MTAPGTGQDFDTVILTGGSAARMGGADKPALAVGDTPMLVSVAQAATSAGTSRLILVGPARPGAVDDGLVALAHGRSGWLAMVQEEPAGSGPVAGLRRGLAEATARWLVLLAADLPFVTAAHLTAMLTAGRLIAQDRAADPVAGFSNGVVAVDASGHPQWLISCWRAVSLRAALTRYDGGSLRGLFTPLRPALIRLEATGILAPWLDCDTPADLAAAQHAWQRALRKAEADS